MTDIALLQTVTIWYDEWFAPKNRQTSYQFN